MTKEKFTLFTYLKNPDLHAISAFEALTTLCKVDFLKGLKKYTVWEIDINASSTHNKQQQLDTILDTTYYIVNPNKEAYHFNVPPSSQSFKQMFLRVESKDGFDDETLRHQIAKKCSVSCEKINKYIAWELLFDHSYTINIEQILKEICHTTSREKGLLVNPIYEKCSFI